MLAQLVQDLLHLERRPDRLDQHGRPNGAARDTDNILRPDEHVVPQPSLEMRLDLGEVKVRARATAEQLATVVQQVQPEIEQRAGDGRAVYLDVALDEMPAARPHDERRKRVAQRVRLSLR